MPSKAYKPYFYRDKWAFKRTKNSSPCSQAMLSPWWFRELALSIAAYYTLCIEQAIFFAVMDYRTSLYLSMPETCSAQDRRYFSPWQQLSKSAQSLLKVELDASSSLCSQSMLSPWWYSYNCRSSYRKRSYRDFGSITSHGTTASVADVRHHLRKHQKNKIKKIKRR